MNKNNIIIPLEINGEGLSIGIKDISKVSSYRTGDLVMKKGKFIKNILILTEGVAQYVMKIKKKEVGLRALFSPCIINDISFILNNKKKKKIRKSVRMLTPGKVFYINSESLISRDKDFNAVSSMVLLQHLIKLRRDAFDTIETIYDSDEKKIGGFLLLLSKKRGTTVNHSEKWKKVKINIPITEEVLSKILNIPETSVYKILINLEKGGYLKRSGNSCTLLYYSRWNFLFRDDYQKALSI